MASYHRAGQQQKRFARVPIGAIAGLPDRVEIALQDIAGVAKEGLLALSVGVGLKVMQQLMAAEVTVLVGPKGKHNRERQAVRHGTEQGSVVLGGRRVQVERPRARTMAGREVSLATYETFQDEALLNVGVLERLVYGMSTRSYPAGLEPVGQALPARGTSKSVVSRRLIAGMADALRALQARPLGDRRYLALLLDGVIVAEHAVLIALGIDADGHKQVLGVWEGATENATVCRALLADLVERGFRSEEGLLVLIDGAKALRAAVRDVFGEQAAVQRCQVHKKRNVLEHLPEAERAWVSRKLEQAWQESTEARAVAALQAIADKLADPHPGAAASVREGLAETVTVIRLGLPETLRQALRSTNAIESAIEKMRLRSRNVKRWRDGQQVLRWSAAGLREAEKGFRRIKGYRELPVLAVALAKVCSVGVQKEQSA